MSYGPIDYNRLQSLSKHKPVIEAVYRFGLSNLYLCRIATAEDQRADSVTKYWKFEENRIGGYIEIPPGLFRVCIYSIATALYPVASFKFTMPELEPGQYFWFGLEEGSAYGGGIAAFQFAKYADGTERLWVSVGARWTTKRFPIEQLLPADYKTAPHAYTVEHYGSQVYFFIDKKVVAVVLNTDSLSTYRVVANPPPYGVYLTEAGGCPEEQRIFIEGFSNGKTMRIPISPYFVRLAESRPRGRVWELYQAGTNTLLRGSSVTGAVTSHPVPVLGFKDKTIYFMADQGGSLSIEVYTTGGNWREYDSVSVTANKLLYYKMTGDAIAVRVTYTPATTPATILEAEMVTQP